MKTITVKNLTIQFDSVSADPLQQAKDTIELINLELSRSGLMTCPQIMNLKIDPADVSVSCNWTHNNGLVDFMDEKKTIRQIKRSLIGRIKSLISPHLWESGYSPFDPERKEPRKGTMVFAFKEKRVKNLDGDVENSPCRYLRGSNMTQCFQGFYSEGLILDVAGGGVEVLPFSWISAEELILLEEWTRKNLDKEIALIKKSEKT